MITGYKQSNLNFARLPEQFTLASSCNPVAGFLSGENIMFRTNHYKITVKKAGRVLTGTLKGLVNQKQIRAYAKKQGVQILSIERITLGESDHAVPN